MSYLKNDGEVQRFLQTWKTSIKTVLKDLSEQIFEILYLWILLRFIPYSSQTFGSCHHPSYMNKRKAGGAVITIYSLKIKLSTGNRKLSGKLLFRDYWIFIWERDTNRAKDREGISQIWFRSVRNMNLLLFSLRLSSIQSK